MSSCAMPQYKHTYESTKGLDLRSGKYLVNHIESDLYLGSREAVAERLIKKLQKVGDATFIYIDSVNISYLLPSQMQFELAPEAMATLKQTTDFDFIINVKASRLQDEMSWSIALPNSNSYENQSEVYIDVYDIASGQRIYSQRIIASVRNPADEGLHLTKSARGLIFGSINKGVKEIKKYSPRI